MATVTEPQAAIPQINLKEVRANVKVKAYIDGANDLLKAMGYTEHGFRHAGIVAAISRHILVQLGYDARRAELAGIAGYLHDIGNAINRNNHPEIGAVMSLRILEEMGMSPKEIAPIIGAIGNHEELHGEPISALSAAVIIADKSDVHYSRVQNTDPATFDIHDRVNYAVNRSRVHIDAANKTIELDLQIDPAQATMVEYFEIFLARMVMCRKAAQLLGQNFQLRMNDVELD